MEDELSGSEGGRNSGGVGPLSDKLNKQTLKVKDLKVGMNRHSFKFEGLIGEKS